MGPPSPTLGYFLDRALHLFQQTPFLARSHFVVVGQIFPSTISPYLNPFLQYFKRGDPPPLSFSPFDFCLFVKAVFFFFPWLDCLAIKPPPLPEKAERPRTGRHVRPPSSMDSPKGSSPLFSFFLLIQTSLPFPVGDRTVTVFFPL